MKKFIAVRLILATVFVMLMSGCSTTAEKINSLIDDTLNNSEELTPEEWQQRDSLLEELMNEYEANKEAYTPEEQAQIDQALGKYFGTQVKQGVEQTKQGVQEFLGRVPGFLEGFMEGIGAQADSLE